MEDTNLVGRVALIKAGHSVRTSSLTGIIFLAGVALIALPLTTTTANAKGGGGGGARNAHQGKSISWTPRRPGRGWHKTCNPY